MASDPRAWWDVAPLPEARRCATATSHDGVSILLLGGTAIDGSALGSVREFSISQNTWSKGTGKATGQIARSEAAAVTLDASNQGPVPPDLRGKTVVAGGQLDVGSTTGPTPGALRCVGPTAAVQVYDADKHVWSSLPDLQFVRRGLGLATRGATVYAIGGYNGNAYVATVEALDLAVDPAARV